VKVNNGVGHAERVRKLKRLLLSAGGAWYTTPTWRTAEQPYGCRPARERDTPRSQDAQRPK